MRVAETELAWAAGFFDGEGSVTYLAPADRSPRIVVQVAQVNPQALRRFAAAVEGRDIQGPYKPKTENSRPYYKWSSERYDEALRIFQLLGVYLSDEKTMAFSRSLSAYKIWLDRAECGKGHEMKDYGGNKRGRYCPTCRGEAARNRRIKCA